MTAGVQDPKMNGIRVWHGGRFSAESLSLQLNGSGSKNLEFIDALYVGQGDESKYKNPAEQISVLVQYAFLFRMLLMQEAAR